jgi:hypothetical protein
MKYCLNCGDKLPEKANFCPNCGVTIEKKRPILTRAEMYKKRSEEATEIDEEFPEDGDNEIEQQTRSTTISSSSRILNQLKNFVIWLKHNPLVAILPILIALAVFLWLNKIVGAVLFVLIIVCGYLYVLKVGPDDNQAEQKLRQSLKVTKDWFTKRIQSSKKSKLTDEPQMDKVENFEERQNDSEPITNDFTQTQAKESAKPEKIKRAGHTLKQKLLMIGAGLLLITTYIGPFASAIVAGYSTPTTLLSILKTLGTETLLLGLIVGPIMILLGAWFSSKWIIKFGSWVNLVAYGYTFYVIYENEAETSGFPSMFSNVHLGWSGYLAVGITILILAFGSTRKKRKRE